jgi:hypothetical protein
VGGVGLISKIIKNPKGVNSEMSLGRGGFKVSPTPKKFFFKDALPLP